MKINTRTTLKLVLENLPAILTAIATLVTAIAGLIHTFGH